MDWLAETLFKYFNFWEMAAFSIAANFLPYLMPERGKYIRKAQKLQWQNLQRLWYRLPMTPMNKFEEKAMSNMNAVAESDSFMFQLVVLSGYFALIFVLGLVF